MYCAFPFVFHVQNNKTQKLNSTFIILKTETGPNHDPKETTADHQLDLPDGPYLDLRKYYNHNYFLNLF